MLLGAHESVAGGPALVFERAAADGGEALQLFTRSGRRWDLKPISATEAQAFQKAWAAHPAIGSVVAHCSYLINLAAADEAIRARSLKALGEELDRCAMLGVPWLVLHPGAVGEDELPEVGITRIAAGLDQLLIPQPELTVRICLETTAGQGHSVGHRFEQLRQILDRMQERDRIGICFDTAHAFAAGYELRTAEGYARTWAAFDEALGPERLRVLHLNDSAKPLTSRVDRHACIGQGWLGLDPFRRLVNDQRFAGLPAILETPVDHKQAAPYKAELALLRTLLA